MFFVVLFWFRSQEGYLDDERMRLIAHLEDVVGADHAKARVRGLEVVERLAHVALGREDERLEAVVRGRHLLGTRHLAQPLEHLRLA